MTSERERRMHEVLTKRQLDLTVIFENVWDLHNIAAVLRTCDAVGVQEVHIISTTGKKESKLGKKSSASASKWLTIHHHTDVKNCFDEVRKKYSKIYSTKLATGSLQLYDIDLTQSLALVFGNEKEGVSNLASTLSDCNFVIPQAGMIQSLNISVACAVTLYECYRQRNVKGFYSRPASPDAVSTLFEEWKRK